MTLNGIICVGYNRTADGFAALLRSTSREQILAMPTNVLSIAADNGGVVETFYGLGPVTRITEDLNQKQFEVFFPNDDGTHNRVATLEMANQGLQSQLSDTLKQLSAAQQALDFLLLNQPM